MIDDIRACLFDVFGTVVDWHGSVAREVRRVGWRYLDRGLEAALQDEPRPHPPRTP